MRGAKQDLRLSQAWFDAIKHSVTELDNALAGINNAPEAETLLEDLRSVIDNADAQVRNSEQVYLSLNKLGEEAGALRGSVSEMIRLEERMKGIIDSGTQLVRRLRPADNTPAD